MATYPAARELIYTTIQYSSFAIYNMMLKKKGRVEDWGHGIWNFQQAYWTIEVKKFGNSMGQLKKKQNFQGCSSKNSCAVWNFHDASWFLTLDGISEGCHTILLNFQGLKLVFSGILRLKVTNLKFPGGF